MQTIEKTERYLIMVDPCTNNDKYFKMIPSGDTFQAEFNKVGLVGNTKEYPMAKWDALYVSKIAKGYVDKTELRKNAIEPKEGKKVVSKIKDSVRDIVEKLQRLSRRSVEENYETSFEVVTEEMIAEAQGLIDSLGKCKNLWQFNDALVKLFSVIPRRMSNVIDYCASNASEFGDIIEKEQEILDNMKSQVGSTVTEVEKDYLEQLNADFEPVSDKERDEIISHLDKNTQFKRAWRVTNYDTEKRFQDYVKKNKITKTKLLYHGSRSENWWSIVTQGLALHPTNAVITGKMFGHGLYFATRSRKSAGYTSTRGSYWANGNDQCGYMAVYEVAYGNPEIVHHFSNNMPSLKPDGFKRKYQGKHCIHAKAGAGIVNDEIVIFDEKACTIHYLIEFTQ